MSLFRNLSIKRKIMTIVMLTSCIALVAAGAAIVAYSFANSRANLVGEISTLADITAKNCAPPTTLGHPEEAESILANLSREGQIQAACIYKEGKVWAKYPNTAPASGFPATPAPGTYNFDKNSLVLSRPIIDPNNTTIGVIYIQASLDTMYSRLRQYAAIVGAFLLIASGVAFLISAPLQGVISRPLLKLSA